MTWVIENSRENKESSDSKTLFLESAGYSEDDLLAWNPLTMKFSMRNGGLYRFTDDGEIEHIGGPSPDPADRI